MSYSDLYYTVLYYTILRSESDRIVNYNREIVLYSYEYQYECEYEYELRMSYGNDMHIKASALVISAALITAGMSR